MVQVVRWWLREGGERCDFCLRSYPWEGGCRCWRCDGALCPLCVEREVPGASLLCPGCVEPEEA